MEDKKRKSKIPSITTDRLDKATIDPSIGSSKEDRHAYAFIKDREPTQAFQIRLPVSIWRELKELAFKKDSTLNKLCNEAILNFVKNAGEEKELKKIRDNIK